MSAKKNIPVKKTNVEPAKKVQTVKSSTTLFDRWEKWISNNSNITCISLVILSLLFSVLLFDVKISEANDDSLYIEGAYNFSKDIHHEFTANAPLYPLLLSIPVKIFGINLIVLKSLSILFFLLSQVAMFFAFRNRIPYLVLIPVILIVSINSYFLYFASQTFTECLYILLQALLLLSVFSLPDVKGKISAKLFAPFLFAGLMLFFIGFCKNIAVGSIVAVVFFLILQRKFWQLLYVVIAYVVVRVPFEIIKGMLWPGQNQFGSQSAILRQKDPYNPSKGYEDMDGFIQRFQDNIGLYIGKRLYQILGFVSPDDTMIRPGLVFIFFVLLIPAIYFAFKRKNKVIQLVLIYSIALLSLTFIVLQKSWDQPRMVLVYSALLLIVVFYGLHEMLKKSSFSQVIYLFIVSIIFFSCFFSTINKATKNYQTLKQNFGGDIYYGYTPDWSNFLKMSRYCADSLPANSYVASRKAPMSFVYSNGKKFYPIYTVISADPDSVLTIFKRDSVTHIILASLRRNPKKNDGYVINTMNRMFAPVAQKYPQKLKLVKQIGESEPAYLYEIKY